MLLIFRIPQWEPILIHHLLAIVGCVSMIGEHAQLAMLGSLLFLTEFTNPQNNMDWYLTQYGLGWSRAGRILRGFFVVSWFCFRIVPFWYIYYLLFMHRGALAHVTPILQAIMVGNVGFLTFLNYYWFCAGPFFGYFKVVFLGHPVPKEKQN